MALTWYYSGASGVVTSLWDVDDDATRDLMIDFMTRAKTMTPSAALAEAMRDQRLHRPNYRDWAGFVVFGALPTETATESPSPRTSDAKPLSTHSTRKATR
jgi:CHAT domain-containing protein